MRKLLIRHEADRFRFVYVYILHNYSLKLIKMTVCIQININNHIKDCFSNKKYTV